MLDSSSAVLDPDAVFVNAQSLVSLAYKIFIRLVLSGGIGSHHQSRPERIFLCKVRLHLGCGFEDGIDPVEMSLEV